MSHNAAADFPSSIDNYALICSNFHNKKKQHESLLCDLAIADGPSPVHR
jgi:hypothetical protein